MKKRKIYFGLVIAGLIVILAWASAGMLGVNAENKKYNVSVIVNDSNNDRWIAMREGLEQAAKDNDIQLNYVLTGVLTDLEEESTFMEREKENGADGIIIQPVSSENAYAVFEKVEDTTAIMLLETDAEPEGIYAVTAPDNTYIGETLAKEVLSDYGEKITGKKIGILGGSQTQNSMKQRIDGVMEVLEEAGVTVSWVLPDATENLQRELDTQQSREPVDILITLGNTETEAAVDYLLAEKDAAPQMKIYGEGCSEKTVYYLDKGMITTLVVPNEFNMGYQSMNAIARQLKYGSGSAKNIVIDSLVIDKSNLYEEENQKILFPIVQ